MNVIDEYIASCPPETHERMMRVRELIRSAAPDATEKISWQMPTFYLKGNLVHFARAKNHLGLYPGASGVANFEEELKTMGFKYSKGAIQLPDSRELPEDLITRIVAFRVAENTGSR